MTRGGGVAFHFGGVAPGTADTADAGVLHRVLEFSLLSPMGSLQSGTGLQTLWGRGRFVLFIASYWRG